MHHLAMPASSNHMHRLDMPASSNLEDLRPFLLYSCVLLRPFKLSTVGMWDETSYVIVFWYIRAEW